MSKINPIFNQGAYNNSRIRNEKTAQSKYNGNIYQDYQAYINSQHQVCTKGNGEKVTIKTDENGYTTETISINDVIVKETVKRPDGSICTIKDYEQGIIFKQTNYTQNAGEIVDITTFNDKGIQIKNENILDNTITEYNEKGNLLSVTKSGKIVESKTYYADGVTIKSEWKSKGSNIVTINEKTYDEKGNVLNEYYETLPMNIIDWIFDNGLIIKDGKFVAPSEIYNETDVDALLQNRGKTREQYEEYVNKINLSCSYDTYQYDADGRILEHTKYAKDKESIQQKITYEYQGNTVTQKKFDGDNQLINRIETTTIRTKIGTHKDEKEYDANDNLQVTTSADYDENGTLKNRISTYADGTFDSETIEDTDNGYIHTIQNRDGSRIISYYTIIDEEEIQTRFQIINPDGSIEIDE